MRLISTRTYERGVRKLLSEELRVNSQAIYLLTVYSKSDRDDLTSADIKALSRMVAAINQESTER